MKLLAIDANSIINRAFYAIKPLSNKKGVFTNAVMGFLNIYLKALSDIKPDCIAAAFDTPKPTFRHEKFLTYKANRKPMSEELAMQFPYIKEILKAMGIAVIEKEGWEADDILGTLAKTCDDSGNECVVLTGDRDSLQLITNYVNVLLAKNITQQLYDKGIFEEEYGFSPINLIDYKALAGDSSDNIKGVTGIGEKTAKTLISKFVTIENLYENIESCGLKGLTLDKLKNGKQDALDSKWLATIATDAPISRSINDYKIGKPNSKKLSEILTELEMLKTLEKLGLKPVKPKKVQAGQLTFGETETTRTLNYTALENLSDLEGDLCYLYDGKTLLINSKGLYKIESSSDILDFFNLANKKFTFGAKTSYKFATAHSWELKNLVFDAEIAAYLLSPDTAAYSIQRLCMENNIEYTSDIEVLPELCDKLYDRLDKTEMLKLFNEIEMPLIEVLADMEIIGIGADRNGIFEFGEKLRGRIDGLQKEIFAHAGKEFNISSTQQLAKILYQDLWLPAKKKTKTGFSTDSEALEAISDRHEIVPLILEYRKCTKLLSTYVDGLLKTIIDGRIHTSFNQTETRTGRISSKEPNLQNIPVRTELGREMRKFFVAGEGKTLVDADYSQIELRILAHITGDENMLEAFRTGVDIHTRTASQVFNTPEAEVTSQMRSMAKAVNFGILYGMGAFSLSKEIGVSVAAAKRYIENYLGNFQKVEEFIEETLEKAIDDGYVTTMFGRRREIQELKMANKNLRNFGERVARNTPIQGAAADIIKLAMIKVYRRLKEEKLPARLLLQIHDELIVECDENIAEKVAAILQEEMSGVYKMNVPLTVDAHIGKTWFEAKGQ